MLLNYVLLQIIYRDIYKTKTHVLYCVFDLSVSQPVLVYYFCFKTANTNMILVYDFQEKEP